MTDSLGARLVAHLEALEHPTEADRALLAETRDAFFGERPLIRVPSLPTMALAALVVPEQNPRVLHAYARAAESPDLALAIIGETAPVLDRELLQAILETQTGASSLASNEALSAEDRHYIVAHVVSDMARRPTPRARMSLLQALDDLTTPGKDWPQGVGLEDCLLDLANRPGDMGVMERIGALEILARWSECPSEILMRYLMESAKSCESVAAAQALLTHPKATLELYRAAASTEGTRRAALSALLEMPAARGDDETALAMMTTTVATRGDGARPILASLCRAGRTTESVTRRISHYATIAPEWCMTWIERLPERARGTIDPLVLTPLFESPNAAVRVNAHSLAAVLSKTPFIPPTTPKRR